MPIHFLDGIDAIAPAAWNALAGDEPFLRHEFLAALEGTGCAAPATGWRPRHLVIGDLASPEAIAPLYLKDHSWGEFVFDMAWARAFEQRGIAYYPKLANAIPFTPATGPRLLVRAGPGEDARRAALLAAMQEDTLAHGRSSAHALFLDEPAREAARRAGWLLRSDCHFQWRQRGYRDLDDFLATFTAEKRKKAKRERRRVDEAGIRFEMTLAGALDATRLAAVHALHADTFHRHGHLPYLSLACFRQLAATLGHVMPVALGLRGNELVAAAVFFRSRDALYGRYWGTSAGEHSLHFEACYWQGVEYCLREGLARFEPGTQGEHKLARGFEPTTTWSAHFIADPPLRAALGNYLRREAEAVAGYADEAGRHLPFRREGPPA